MTLGPNTKAAIARLVGTLPFLHSEAAAVPTQHRSFWADIKAKYEAHHTTTTGADPKVEAAQSHAEEIIAAALDADANAVAPVEPSNPPLGDLPSGETFHAVELTPRPFPEPVPEPVVPLFPITTEAPK